MNACKSTHTHLTESKPYRMNNEKMQDVREGIEKERKYKRYIYGYSKMEVQTRGAFCVFKLGLVQLALY